MEKARREPFFFTGTEGTGERGGGCVYRQHGGGASTNFNRRGE